ncbi:MAG TPA: hypothetical protein VIY26_16230 [Acidimicrobiales bacterium]
MAKHARHAAKARPWRSRLHGFVSGMASDDWEEAGASAPGPAPDDPQVGGHASLDEVLRDAAESRDPDDVDGAQD